MSADIDRKRWVEGRVHSLHRWTDKLYSIRVEADVAPFKAGQFTKLGLVIDDELIGRPYSYVNAPQESPLEFYFVTVADGPLSNRMLTLQPGDAIQVMRNASGFLTLEEVPDARYLWLLSTGTAIGPFLSILKTGTPWQRFEKVVLVHAVRLAEELSFADTIQSLSVNYPDQFQFIPFVSREPSQHALQARIPPCIEDGRLERRAGLLIEPATTQLMLCGNPDMVRDTSEVLKARGLERNRRRAPGQFSVENYW
jgi:ferredoxin--NADP+ reductase